MPATSTLPQVLSAVVEGDPEAPAIADDGTEITYGELDERSSRLARVLIAEGVGPGTRVPVALARSVDAVIAAWAVLKSGAAVTPIDANDDAWESIDAALPAKLGITNSQNRAAAHDGVEWIVVDDVATRARIDEQSGRPVSYSERTRLLDAGDIAFAAVDGSFVLDHGRAVALASGTAPRTGSRTNRGLSAWNRRPPSGSSSSWCWPPLRAR
ncbi:AMP-binding protein [Rhodococcus hoagii]|nr:AMP-binding protein [Prescottella equi]